MMDTDKIISPGNDESGFLSLGDDTFWQISGLDKNSVEAVSCLKNIMGLHDSSPGCNKQLIVYTNSNTDSKKNLTVNSPGTRFCDVDYSPDMDMLVLQLMKIAALLRQESEKKMGFLIHGALAEYKGRGVILAGRGGIGKTTAVGRLPETWTPLSDDLTLIVCDSNGSYMAHPWPTWSRFMFGGSGGSWNVNRNLPLAGVYFLKRGKTDGSVVIDRPEAVCRLVQSAEEALLPITLRSEKYDSRDMRINRFNNIVTFTESVPAYILSFAEKGNFWQEIEKDIFRNKLLS